MPNVLSAKELTFAIEKKKSLFTQRHTDLFCFMNIHSQHDFKEKTKTLRTFGTYTFDLCIKS